MPHLATVESSRNRPPQGWRPLLLRSIRAWLGRQWLVALTHMEVVHDFHGHFVGKSRCFSIRSSNFMNSAKFLEVYFRKGHEVLSTAMSCFIYSVLTPRAYSVTSGNVCYESQFMKPVLSTSSTQAQDTGYANLQSAAIPIIPKGLHQNWSVLNLRDD